MQLVRFIFLSLILISCGEELSNAALQKKELADPPIEAIQLDLENLSAGTLYRVENFPSEFIKERHVDIWVPDHYSKNKKFAVLYMHDGQMLFDSTTTWNKQEWQVDEWASKLMIQKKTRDFIVVAIHNISELRWYNYFPQKVYNKYLSFENIAVEAKKNLKEDEFRKIDSDNYLKFLIQELKPYIDSNFSVHSDKENTFIAGSSMGGLISMYAICEYPDIFDGAACISTHWPGTLPMANSPIPNAFFEYMKASIPETGKNRWYFDYGTETLDQHYIQYAAEVDAIFTMKGFDHLSFRNIKFQGDAHDEKSWASRLDIPLTFLLGNTSN